MKLLIATHNRGKVREFADLLSDTLTDCLFPDDVGLGGLEVDETGDTFEANAALKAQAFARASGLLTLGDDSGLVVDALDGRPGIYSARYGGKKTERARCDLLLSELAGVPDARRTARFVCVLALAQGDSDLRFVRGECAGRIAHAVSDGKHGFGYDPLFIPDGYAVTLAELPPAEKHRLSHRGRAAAALLPLLNALSDA